MCLVEGGGEGEERSCGVDGVALGEEALREAERVRG